MKLIDKDALLAEIERRHKELCERYDESCKDGAIPSVSAAASSIALHSLMSFINSLEVKEVDLKDEASIRDELLKYLGSYSSRDFAVAKHFFELGLKAQKGEKVC